MKPASRKERSRIARKRIGDDAGPLTQRAAEVLYDTGPGQGIGFGDLFHDDSQGAPFGGPRRSLFEKTGFGDFFI